MFLMPGDTPVTLTDRACARIEALMSAKNAYGLRIGLKKGGCAGMEYTMDLAEAVAPNEIVVEQGGARVLIAPAAQMYLLGTTIDYAQGALESGFSFDNPNVSEACGCGESVSFKPLEGARVADPSNPPRL